MDTAFSRNMPDTFRVFVLNTAALALSACSSVSVDKVTPLGARPVAPQKIYVQDFELPTKVARVDRAGPALENFLLSFKRSLTMATVERVEKRIVPAQSLQSDAAIRREPAWVVTGKFITVNQGSRALRAAVGLGMGGTKIETVVTVCDVSGSEPREVLKFVTTGGSNAQPGAVFGLIMPNYWLIAADFVGKGLPGLNADVIRTSRQIVAVLSEYMAQHGLLPPEKIYRAKKAGKWP